MGDNFERLGFDTVFSVESVITFFYMELEKGFRYDGERHDFWEMVYVDKGAVICTAGENRFVLKSGEATFHRPNEFHNLMGNGTDAANISIVTFDCHSPAMDAFDGKIFKLTAAERQLLSRLFSEGLSAFAMEDPHNPLIQRMQKKPDAPFGSSQAAKNFLELFLIELYRSGFTATKTQRVSGVIDGVEVAGQVREILEYLQAHLREKQKISDIARSLHIGESQVKKCFAQFADGGVMHYFTAMKIKEARRLIREGEKNMADIAGYLGFDTPQYFSRCFLRFSGMTPSEYKKSITSF